MYRRGARKLESSDPRKSFGVGQSPVGQSEDQRFHWTVSTAPYDDGADAAKRQLTTLYAIRVAVNVKWQNGAATDKQLDLATLTVGRMN